MHKTMSSLWWRDSNQMASGKPGAVHISDPEFVARAADVLWLTQTNIEFARMAVPAYLASARRLEELDGWPPSVDRYERALRLSRQIESKGDLTRNSAETIVERVVHYGGNDPSWFTFRMVELLYESRQGEPLELAAIVKKVATAANAQRDFRRQREYLKLESKLLKRAGKSEKAEDSLVDAAQTYVSEAEEREQDDSFMAAHSFWEDAIQAYRDRPSLRNQLPILKDKLAEAGRRTRDEMKKFSHSVDIKDIVEKIQSEFESLPLDDALFKFVSAFPLMDESALREQATESLKNTIAGMFPTRVFDYEGRTVAVHSGGVNPSEAGYATVLNAKIQETASHSRNFGAHANIAPALRTINFEHVFDEETLVQYLENSALIPSDRMPIFTRGFAAGFRYDFLTASHLLIPQLEAGLRNLANIHGLVPRHVKADGTEPAWGFERLLSEQVIRDAIGESFVFELNSLLIESFGPNFRHNLAHGLIPASVFDGPDALHAWWLCLRLAILLTPEFREYFDRLKRERATVTAPASRE